jgi:peptidoglycan/LPS O-acetylase OafA/YrhL
MTTQSINIEEEAAGVISSFLDTHLQPNRVVTLVGPVVAIISGAVAAWLGTHFPGLGLNTGTTAATITQGINFAIGALVTLALQHKWLAGWQQYQATVAAGGASPASSVASSPPLQPQGVYDPASNVPTAVAAVATPGAADVGAGPPEGSGSASDGGQG